MHTPRLPQGLAVSVVREEEVSQLLTEMEMGGRRKEIRGQRAQELQRSPRNEPGPGNVEKSDMADKLKESHLLLGMDGPRGPENLVLVGRPHLTMESEATPLPVSCQGWTKQGLMGKGQPPLSSGLSFPLMSLSVQVPQDLAKGGRDPYISLSGLKVHQPEIQEHTSSHRPSAPAALSGGSVPMWELSPGSSWNLLLRLEEVLTKNLPRLPTFQRWRQPGGTSRREEEAWSPSHIPTPQRPADSTIGTFH